MSFEVEYFTIDPTAAANKYVLLQEGVPVDSSNVVLDIVGGTAQYYGASGDFGVTDSTKVRWDGAYALNGQITTNDRIRVIYDRS